MPCLKALCFFWPSERQKGLSIPRSLPFSSQWTRAVCIGKGIETVSQNLTSSLGSTDLLCMWPWISNLSSGLRSSICERQGLKRYLSTEIPFGYKFIYSRKTPVCSVICRVLHNASKIFVSALWLIGFVVGAFILFL